MAQQRFTIFQISCWQHLQISLFLRQKLDFFDMIVFSVIKFKLQQCFKYNYIGISHKNHFQKFFLLSLSFLVENVMLNCTASRIWLHPLLFRCHLVDLCTVLYIVLQQKMNFNVNPVLPTLWGQKWPMFPKKLPKWPIGFYCIFMWQFLGKCENF